MFGLKRLKFARLDGSTIRGSWSNLVQFYEKRNGALQSLSLIHI